MKYIACRYLWCSEDRVLWSKRREKIWLLLNENNKQKQPAVTYGFLNRIYIYGTKQPGKEYSQLGAYWNRFTPHGFFRLLHWFCMHCNKAGWNKLRAAHASGGRLSSTVLTLPSSSKHFICLWRSRTKGIIQGKIDDKGYNVCCNIHFPNNNVREGEDNESRAVLPHHLLSSTTQSVSSLWASFSLLYLAYSRPSTLRFLLTLQFLLSHLWSSLSIRWEIPFTVHPLFTTSEYLLNIWTLGNMSVLHFKSISQSLWGWKW